MNIKKKKRNIEKMLLELFGMAVLIKNVLGRMLVSDDAKG